MSILEKSPNRQISKLSLQKILFLFSLQKEEYYRFIPYQYGCYSLLANKDLSVLSDYYKLVANHDKNWQLLDNNSYFDQLTDNDKKILTHLFSEYDVANENNLISHIYDNYPYYTINSKRKLTSRQLELVKNEKYNINSQGENMVFSIGYEGKSIDEYLNLLIKNNIDLLCDVRKNPISMKYGFSRNTLATFCKNLGIDYIHMPGLGIESQQRESLKTTQDYKMLFDNYRSSLCDKEIFLAEAIALIKKHKRVAFTCFELSHTYCHRGTLIEYLANNFEIPKVEHL
jgi:hypothetical protein